MRAPILLTTLLLMPSLAITSACTMSDRSSATTTTATADRAGRATTAPLGEAAARGLAFAQSHCASCHAVAGGTSPHADAPPFADVINDPDLSDETLIPWLRASHNFPAIMNFEIQPDHIDDLAAHMMTLKDPNYKPRI